MNERQERINAVYRELRTWRRERDELLAMLKDICDPDIQVTADLLLRARALIERMEAL